MANPRLEFDEKADGGSGKAFVFDSATLTSSVKKLLLLSHSLGYEYGLRGVAESYGEDFSREYKAVQSVSDILEAYQNSLGSQQNNDDWKAHKEMLEEVARRFEKDVESLLIEGAKYLIRADEINILKALTKLSFDAVSPRWGLWHRSVAATSFCINISEINEESINRIRDRIGEWIETRSDRSVEGIDVFIVEIKEEHLEAVKENLTELLDAESDVEPDNLLIRLKAASAEWERKRAEAAAPPLPAANVSQEPAPAPQPESVPAHVPALESVSAAPVPALESVSAAPVPALESESAPASQDIKGQLLAIETNISRIDTPHDSFREAKKCASLVLQEIKYYTSSRTEEQLLKDCNALEEITAWLAQPAPDTLPNMHTHALALVENTDPSKSTLRQKLMCAVTGAVGAVLLVVGGLAMCSALGLLPGTFIAAAGTWLLGLAGLGVGTTAAIATTAVVTVIGEVSVAVGCYETSRLFKPTPRECLQTAVSDPAIRLAIL